MNLLINDFITIPEAAMLQGLHVNTVRNQVKIGIFPNTFRKGKNIVLVYRPDVEALQQKQKEEREAFEKSA